MSNLFDVRGKTALVTGASYGLGVTFAEALASAGANVVLAARSLDKLRQVEARIRERDGEVWAARCDVAVSSEVKELFARACDRFGRIDIVVKQCRDCG